MRKQQKPRVNVGREGAQTASPGPAKELFLIVGIGASAGGLEAFTHLLRNLPVDSGMAFVLVQHLDPAHESALTGILGRTTPMPVQEATDDLPVEPNHVYVIPPNMSMAIAGGRLKLRRRSPSAGAFRSIDFFFESLARDRRERAIGVILSGTASDGTLGAEAIKAEGGLTFAQDASAKYDSMPRSAIAAGFVDFVLSPENIAKELARIAKHPYLAALEGGARGPASPEGEPQSRPVGNVGLGKGGPGRLRPREEDDSSKRIVALLRSHSGVDFSLYKRTTIARRVARRMVLNKLDSLEAYAGFLRGNTRELDALYGDVLINVTSFFRDPEGFETLKRQVFPRLLRPRRAEVIRLWVLGCSTGQEAYSLVMAFTEFCEQARRAPKLQVFATDLSEAMLAKARAGLYAKNLVENVAPERLRRFFVAEDGGYRVIKALREVCIFARHNLLCDPPFSQVDLISCRNLLIYIDPALHQQSLLMFHYALRPDGFLFLGASESVDSLGHLFEAVDRKHRIYAKRPRSPLPLGRRPLGWPARPKGEIPAAPKPGPGAEGLPGALSAEREADRVALRQYAPPAVLIDAELQVLQFRGDTSPFLKPPRGKASFHLLKMAREGLLVPLRAALNQAGKEGKVARRQRVPVAQNGGSRLVNLEVVPLKNVKPRCYLVFFADAGGAEVNAQEVTRPDNRPEGQAARGGRQTPRLAAALRRIAELDQELTETRDLLQSIQEQHEAANEELQASNEEIQSANEELQSVNEELETSKEELESSNEELTTVNEEMANRNQELGQLNSDLKQTQEKMREVRDFAQAVIESVPPLLILDADLRVRTANQSFYRAFGVTADQTERGLLYELGNGQWNIPALRNLLEEVLPRKRSFAQYEVTHDFENIGRRTMLLSGCQVGGLGAIVLSIEDITARKQTEEALQQSARDLDRSNRDLEQFASVASHDLQEPLRAVAGFVRLLQQHLADKLDAKALEYMAGTAEGAARMEQLIADLLAFSRVGAQHTVFAPADLNALLSEALQDLQASIKVPHAEITSDPLPTLPVAASQMTRLFQNLIGNAIKFRSERVLQVHVGARHEKGQWVLSVRDNGIGIQPQYFERIFQIFQRLHTRKVYPGTGIGLAICKKIVERHGGKIWVESQPSQGSTFYFSLPEAAANKP